MPTTPPCAVAVICEYNPPHRGHAHQLAAARADSGAEVVICIMSALATQRGTLAVVDAHTRANAALCMGADVVLSLPFPYSSAAAEHFAAAGVHIATALGAHYLHFGSECADVDRLTHVAALTSSPDFGAALTALQRQQPDMGVMEAREQLLRARLGDDDPLPARSNDLLATAYIAAIQRQGSPLIPLTTPRLGCDYHASATPSPDVFASATALRRLWFSSHDLAPLRPHLPEGCFALLQAAAKDGLAPADTDALLPAILSRLRLADADELSTLCELGGGVAQRLMRAAWEHSPTTCEQLLSQAATRRFTTSRLQRALLYALCGVTEDDVRTPPAYTRLLALSRRGASYLAAIKKSCPLCIAARVSELPDTPAARRLQALEQRLAALYAMAIPTPRPPAYFVRKTPQAPQ